MRGLISGLCAVASVSVAASAQPRTGLVQWQVSRDGVDWASTVTVNPGSTYRIRALAGWTDGPTPNHGFAGCMFEQIDLIGADDTDTFGEAKVGGSPLYFWRLHGGTTAQPWTLQPGSGPSAGSLKIDHEASMTRISLGQIRYACWGGGTFLDYIFDNPILLLDFEAVAGIPKTVTVSAVWARLGVPLKNEFKVYADECGTNWRPIQEAIMRPAHVWIRPNASCVPDFNGDGLVDFSDYLEFLSFYDADDFRADLNGDGFVDFADYLEFLTAFDAGC